MTETRSAADEHERIDPWKSRPILAHVRDFAGARMVGPYALLGALLVRAVAATEPGVVLPPVIGGKASLNLVVAMVGKSGEGKGVADAAARDATNLPTDIPELPIGSGEGIARTFAPLPTLQRENVDPTEGDATTTRAIFTAAEVEGLGAIASRKGSTLLPVLRSMWSGETLGAANAQAHTRVSVPAHSYRACLTVGVQPEAAGPLLHDTRGTAQRFVWLPVSDPEPPEVLPTTPPTFEIRGVDGFKPWTTAGCVLALPEVAQAAMIAHRRAVLRGDDEVDPLDGHAMLTRAKLAAGFMILDGRMGTITPQDWELAGWIMRVSDRTRTRIGRDLAEGKRRAAHARALATAEHDEQVADRKAQRARQGVLRWLESAGELPLNELRKRARSDRRDQVSAVVAELVAEGVVVEVPVESGHRYRLAEGPRSTGTRGEDRTISEQVSDRGPNASTVDPRTEPEGGPVDPAVDPENHRSVRGGPPGPVDLHTSSPHDDRNDATVGPDETTIDDPIRCAVCGEGPMLLAEDINAAAHIGCLSLPATRSLTTSIGRNHR